MAANGKDSKNGEISMAEGKRSGEVVVVIPGEERDAKITSHPDSSKDQKLKVGLDSPLRSPVDSHTSVLPKPVPLSCPSPEAPHVSHNYNKPPRTPTTQTLNRRKSLARSIYSKPRSRFGEPSVQIDSKLLEEVASSMQENVGHGASSPMRRNVSNLASPNNNDLNSAAPTPKHSIGTATTPKTPLMAAPGAAGGVDDGEEIYKKVSDRNKLRHRKVKIKVLAEWVVFACLLGCLIATLKIKKLKHTTFWALEIWKWCVLVMVIFSGMFVSNWFIRLGVFLIEVNFLFKTKVLYFVHSMKKSAQVFIWLTLVLITWVILFKRGVRRSKTASKILDSVTWTIVSLLVGAFLWLLKNFLMKILASSFHVKAYFDRIQEAIFHQYVLQALSGPPVMESAWMFGRTNSVSQLSFQRTKKGKESKEKEVIDMNKLHQIKREKVSASTMKVLVDVISSSGLSTISSALDETDFGGGHEQTDKEITNEEEAIAAAIGIFRNVAQPDHTYIDELDLRRFMLKEEVDFLFPMIDVAETGQIDKKTFTEWVVKVYKGRKALALALHDTKSTVKQLNKLISVVVIVIALIVWLLLMEIATTKVIVFLSSQFVAAAFIFGSTCKAMFESIIFVFVMHPFDLGDRCVIDGVQMTVEEMYIFTTVFLRFDNEKIYYPNSVLASKPISNFFRSPDMGDAFEFAIDFTTPIQKIGLLKDKIQGYLENSPLWHPNHSVVVKEIENTNRMKMALFFNHTMNFQDMGEKNRRRTELIFEMKKFLEELQINYNLLPQEIRLVESGTLSRTR